MENTELPDIKIKVRCLKWPADSPYSDTKEYTVPAHRLEFFRGQIEKKGEYKIVEVIK